MRGFWLDVQSVQKRWFVQHGFGMTEPRLLHTIKPMESARIFTHTEDELLPVLEELRRARTDLSFA
jgi:hypothetical protein